MLRKMVSLLSILTVILGLFGCTKAPEQKTDDVDEILTAQIIDDKDDKDDKEDEQEMPQAVVAPMFVKIFFHTENDSMEPYYMIGQNASGDYYLKSSFDHSIMENEDLFDAFTDIDVSTNEKYALCRELSEQEIKFIKDAMDEAGVITWDGFNKENSLGPNVLDGGDLFIVLIEYEDGTRIKASGSHARPAGYDVFFRGLFDVIWAE